MKATIDDFPNFWGVSGVFGISLKVQFLSRVNMLVS